MQAVAATLSKRQAKHVKTGFFFPSIVLRDSVEYH